MLHLKVAILILRGPDRPPLIRTYIAYDRT
jgi:hypothetical protein